LPYAFEKQALLKRGEKRRKKSIWGRRKSSLENKSVLFSLLSKQEQRRKKRDFVPSSLTKRRFVFSDEEKREDAFP